MTGSRGDRGSAHWRRESRIVFVVAVWGSVIAAQATVSHFLAGWIGVYLATAVAVVGTAPPSAPPSSPPILELPAEELPVAEMPPAGPSVSPSSPRSAALALSHPRRATPLQVPAVVSRKGLYVPAARVLQAARRGSMPGGVAVPAEGARPAGVRLVGVGGLGVGLRDGDVLTEAAGVAATSLGVVVSAVVGARKARVRMISGVFWRDGEAWSLAVEQPYSWTLPSATPEGSNTAPPAMAVPSGAPAVVGRDAR